MDFGFKLPSYGQKENEEKNKQPMMSTVPSKTTGATPSSNKADLIPNKPMMSYNVKGNILTGVSDKTANLVKKYVEENATTPEEKKILMSQIHQEAIKTEQKQAFQKDRESSKAQLLQKSLNTKDPEEKKQIKTTLNIANLSDIIRDFASKNGVDAGDMNDKDVVIGFGTKNPQFQETLKNYLNGDISGVDVAKEIGLIEKPIEEEVIEDSTAIKDVGEGMTSFAGGLPKVLAEMGILDKLADKTRDAINNGEGGLLGDLLLSIANSKAGMDFKKDNPATSYSEFAGGSQVGGNENSKLAKGVETTMDIVSLLDIAVTAPKAISKIWKNKKAQEAVAVLMKGGDGKELLKNKNIKKLWEFIQPKLTKKTRDMFRSNNEIIEKTLFKKAKIVPNSANIDTIKVANEIVDVSKGVDENINIVKNEIKNESTRLKKFTKLFTREVNADDLVKKFDTIEKSPTIVGDIEKTHTKIINKVKEIYSSVTQDASGILDARKQFDDYIQEYFGDIYKSDRLSPLKTTVKDVRKAMNDYLGELTDDVTVKNSLKKQTELFNIKDNLITKGDDMASSKLSKRYKQNESLIKGIGYSAAIGYGGIETIKAVSGN